MRLFAILAALSFSPALHAQSAVDCGAQLQPQFASSQDREIDLGASTLKAQPLSRFLGSSRGMKIVDRGETIAVFYKDRARSGGLATVFPGSGRQDEYVLVSRAFNSAVRSARLNSTKVRLDFAKLRTWASGSGECAIDGRSIVSVLVPVLAEAVQSVVEVDREAPDRSAPRSGAFAPASLAADGDRTEAQNE